MKNQNLSLLTPQDIKQTPEVLLKYAPKWITAMAFADSYLVDEEDCSPIVVVLGTKHKKTQTLTPLQFAVLVESTRLGHSVVTNSNFGKICHTIYSKFSFTDAAKDNIPLARLFASAESNEAVKGIDIVSDLRPENLFKIGAGKPSKNAVELVIKHVVRVADEREAEGTFPASFSKSAYLDNFKNLLNEMQKEASEFISEGVAA